MMKALRVFILFAFTVSTCYSENTEISISPGSSIVLQLPGARCGQYTLLNGLLRPVLVIEKKTPKLLGQYGKRASIVETESGYNLTISDVGLQDDGRYKVASPKVECKDIQYFVTVRALSQEYLEQWGEWSSCVKDCDTNETRSRSRDCSINGGCKDMGPMNATQKCDQADHCPHWSAWSDFGECSANCGKGFKIRSRICLKGSSSLLQTGDCPGPSMQSHMCMTICEVVGVWMGWTEWSKCSTNCGITEIRNRTRLCKDPRDTPNCPGNYTEYEDCKYIPCNSNVITEIQNTTDNVTYSINQISETELADQPLLAKLNLVVMLVIVGAITLIILIVIFMVVRKRLHVKRVNSSRLNRDTQVENATIDKRLTDPPKKAGRPDGVNVYSELGSSFCYNDSEFDDTDDDEDDSNGKTNTDSKENISKEDQDNKTNDEKVADKLAGAGEVNIYDNNIAELNDALTVGLQSQESVYSNPPEEEDPADERIVDDVIDETKKSETNENKETRKTSFEEMTGLFVIPPTRKKSSGLGITRTLEELYRKVSRSKGKEKPNKVEINHAMDVYYDPPAYTETNDPEIIKANEPEVNESTNDNVYENCDVDGGKMEIVPVKSNTVKSEKKTFDETKVSPKDEKNVETPEIISSGSTSEIHPKMKEALDTSEGFNNSDNNKVEEISNDIKADGDHIYVNEEVTADQKNFYKYPRYKYPRPQNEQNHIYDVPKSPT